MPSFCTFVRTEQGLMPSNHDAEEEYKKLKMDEQVHVVIKKPRNLSHHRKWWALISLIHENQTRYETKEQLVAALKFYLGHVDTFLLRDGSTTGFLPKSISFAKMSQEEFGQFYDRTLDFVCEKVVPGLDKEATRSEVEDFLYG